MSKLPIKISRGLLFDVVLIVFEGTLTDFHIIGTLDLIRHLLTVNL